MDNVTEDDGCGEVQKNRVVVVVIEASFLGVCMLVGTFGNCLTIIAVATNVKLQSTANIFVTNLAIADLMVCLILEPFYMVGVIHQEWPLNDGLCTLLGFLSVALRGSSVCSLGCIAINRFITITKPVAVSVAIYTTPMTVFMCVLIWFIPIVFALPPVFGWSAYSFDRMTLNCKISCQSNIYFFIVLSLVLFSIGVIILFCYTGIFIHVWKSKRRVEESAELSVTQRQSNKDEDSSTTSPDGAGQSPQRRTRHSRKKEIRIAINLFIVFIVFCICWLPFVCLSLVDNERNASHRVWRAFSLFSFSTSSINFLLYALKNKHFIAAYKKVLMSPCRKCNT
ncbi:melatonin receptor type 1B-B-like [Ptychodera flava]|uniref:melatonin receptor type 1B-B-like n=1 Tax=Ptychodera flava TaxID=63121 RepID=UPI00396A2F12